MSYRDTYTSRVQNLRVFRQGERRAPHKPLLLLVAIAKHLRDEGDVPFAEAESTLRPLLEQYAPPVVGRHQPELPYWYLRSDEIWEIPGAESFPQQAGGFPTMAALRASSGHLEPGFARELQSDPEFVQLVINILLEDHFPPSIHDDILAAVGLRLPVQERVAEGPAAAYDTPRRDPRFRQAVLRAYEHRCAVTGFRAALGGQYFGCEAAHVQWLSQNGPNTVENGFAVEPTLHKLFDVGAWSLTDDRRVLVSAEFTGSDATVARIRSLHGETVRAPLSGESPVSAEYIRWHREADLGGVFRKPALPL